MATGSGPFSFSWADLWPVFKVVLIAVLGAIITYVNENLASWELGAWAPAVQAAWTTLVAFLARFLPDTRKKP